jgi:hypothetical protein
VGTVTSGVGGLGTGLVRLIVPSLRARVTLGAFPLQRLLVVLVARTWLPPIEAAAQTTNRVSTTGPTFSRATPL